MRILLVDDSPAMRAFIRRVLTLTGIEIAACFEASNGREALELLANTGVDVIFCDVNMPVMDGEQFVDELHNQGLLHQVRVIVVSTDSTVTRMQRMIRLGATGYVRKPFTPEDLRAELDRILDLEPLQR